VEVGLELEVRMEEPRFPDTAKAGPNSVAHTWRETIKILI